jgi:hypothetical protein
VKAYPSGPWRTPSGLSELSELVEDGPTAERTEALLRSVLDRLGQTGSILHSPSPLEERETSAV